MPPPVATFLTLGSIAFLFRREIRQRPEITSALWLPLFWMIIICSRQVSEWLNVFGFHTGAVTLEEGSPLDACVYLFLIVAGVCVLNKRQVQLSQIIRNNKWFTIFFVYCLLSVLWSDFPFVAFKRWIKVLGHPIMALIVLTEPDPEESLIQLMKRCAYIIVPISILFIKYYPDLGRGFDVWSGAATNNGITTNKNALGSDCMIFGFFFAWYLLNIWKSRRDTFRRNELVLSAGFLLAIWWLFSKAQSSTSLVSCIIGVLVVAFLGLPFVNRRLIGTYLISGLALFIAAQLTLDVWAQLLHLLGKSVTLTDRTSLWTDLLNAKINPVFGTGFESFWLGQRFQRLAEAHWWRPNEAHNGYLESYLNLGLIGLGLLIALLIATFSKSRRALLDFVESGKFRLGFLVAVIAYNWTEAAFKNISPIWFVFCLIALDYFQSSLWCANESTEIAEVDIEQASLAGAAA